MSTHVRKFKVGAIWHLRYNERGKDRRRSLHTSNAKEAENWRIRTQARLIENLPPELPSPPRNVKIPGGKWMSMEDFIEVYDQEKLKKLRPKSHQSAVSRLKMIEKAGLSHLGKASSHEAVEKAQQKLLDGYKLDKKVVLPKSKWTVKTVIDTLMTALKFAKKKGWILDLPIVDRVKTSTLRGMRGRPIEEAEFQSMREKIVNVLIPRKKGDERPRVITEKIELSLKSIDFLLRGYWTSSLRKDELLSIHWTDAAKIQPVWPKEGFPYLAIPADQQKNDTEESIPMLPAFSDLLLSVPNEERTGFIFRLIGRRNRTGQIDSGWVGKLIQRVGKAAEVVTYRVGDKDHFASAHDLRRSCAQRLVDAGVDERVIQRVMRHQSFETTRRFYTMAKLQKDAATLWQVHAKKTA